MIITNRNGQIIVEHNSLADKIADANYYLAIAMATGNSRNKRKWLKRIKELENLIKEDRI